MSFEADKQNLILTYRSLVEAVPGSIVTELKGGIFAQGPMRHPICNFALLWDMHDDELELLRNLNVGSWFHLYYVHNGQEPWRPRGFSDAYTLALMNRKHPLEDEDIEPLEACPESGRREITKFMAQQFFARSGQSTIDLVANATANGKNLDLYGFRSKGLISRLFAAAMLVDSEGALGLYNLCVDGSQQGRGHGSRIVKQFISKAQNEGKKPVLQCDEKLVNWYSNLGFERAGRLNAWYFSENSL